MEYLFHRGEQGVRDFAYRSPEGSCIRPVTYTEAELALQPAMFMALNAILQVVDVSITRAKNAKPEDEWSVSDGRSLTRFRDGMVPLRQILRIVL